MSVSVCLVTRNHADSLETAVRSVSGFALETVVLDTGSRDNTVELARSLGCRILTHEWQDDFSAACNQAVAESKGEWFFLLNPDEEVEQSSHPALLSAVHQPRAGALRVQVEQLLQPKPGGRTIRTPQIRLYRKSLGLRYQGRLHPALVPPIDDLVRAQQQQIEIANVVIRRHAYLSTPTEDKIRWVVRLLEAELRDRPKQLGFLIELGRNLLWLHDPRGHEVLAEAADMVWELHDYPAAPDPWVGSLLEYLLHVSPALSRSRVTRDQARELGQRWFADTPPVVWSIASERFLAKDYTFAANALEHLLEMGRTNRFNDSGGFDPNIIGRHALQNLGMCRLALGQWDGARVCFSQLLQDPELGQNARKGMQMANDQVRPPL